MAAADEKPFLVWVIYDHPLDHPNGYVVRPWSCFEGEIRGGHATTVSTLEEARKLIPEGLVRLPRLYGEDPCIAETWL